MATKVHILPELLCNKIAAGEVVERPASVVKELVENSLDAGSGEILVEVEAGGRRLIRVIDDGEGMSREDAFLALERHATSKIGSDEDLFRLRTLGFRGEALPSIAAVSRLTLRSCAQGEMEGWEILAEGGLVKKAQAVGAPQGTALEVRDLFFNTPARRKFLRRDETEFGHIADVVTRLALAHPRVRFLLAHNGRKVIEAFGGNTLHERVAVLLGRPILAGLLGLEAAGIEGGRLRGLISSPDLHRSSGEALFTYVNGRFIRDRLIHHAVLEGYRHLVPRGRYPVAVLFLEIDPALVDVNVHPTKHEVRFRDQGGVHDFIVQAIRDVLRPSTWLEAAPASGEGVPSRPPFPPPAESPAAARHRDQIQEAVEAYGRRQAAAPAPPPSRVAGPAPAATGPAAPELMPEGTGFFSGLQVIGQYRRSYLLCQDGDDLVLIDQHAAHERIGFERLRSQFRRGGVETQTLLFPEVVELEFREAAALAEAPAEILRLGFDLEPFGGRSFAIKGVPRLLQGLDHVALIRDVAAELAALGRSALAEEAVDRLLMTLACHTMVRANQSLSPAAIEALLRDLDGVDFNSRCPHGRPVMKRISLAEVDRMFKRS